MRKPKRSKTMTLVIKSATMIDIVVGVTSASTERLEDIEGFPEDPAA
jgi:hypothetical protein